MRINKVYNVIFVQLKMIKVDTNTDSMLINMSVFLFYLLLLHNRFYQSKTTQKSIKMTNLGG